MLALEDLCPIQRDCTFRREDAGVNSGMYSCYPNGVVRYSVPAGDPTTWHGQDITVTGPDGGVCYTATERRHARPWNQPPGSGTYELAFYAPNAGGYMRVSDDSIPTMVQCNNTRIPMPLGCSRCVWDLSVFDTPSCSGTCPAP